MNIGKMTLDELAVVEAANRALSKTGTGKRFDPDVFQAVAEHELKDIQEELSNSRAKRK